MDTMDIPDTLDLLITVITIIDRRCRRTLVHIIIEEDQCFCAAHFCETNKWSMFKRSEC